MSRDDSILYSGATSVTSELVKPRVAQREEKEKLYYKIKPGVDVVLAEIDKERQAITDLRTIVLDRTTTEKEINTELMARKLYLGYLNTLTAKFENIIRTKK